MSSLKKVSALAAGTAALVMAGAGAASAGSEAEGAAVGSPGVLSGNNVQVPVHIPVNLCGNSVNILGFINPTFGNTCANIDADKNHHDADKNHHDGNKNHHDGGHHG